MEFKVQPKNLAAVEGYNATFFSASPVFNSLSTPVGKICVLHYGERLLRVDEQFHPSCDCWLDNQTICYHDAKSSSNADECCRSIVTLHILPYVNKTLVFSCKWCEECFNRPIVRHVYSFTSECK